ncbi:threonine aldolase [Diaporthe sp. PMI_573]|nr:threonine aldolase [Diaporthaceae sp. PMI_573]
MGPFIYDFRDDYSDGAHSDVLEAIAAANSDSQVPYGEDAYTEAARALIQQKMNATDAAVHLVASGTLANILVIGSCLRPHEAVISVASGHIVVRETGAIEAIGHKIITVPPVNGKLTPDTIVQALHDNAHYPHMAKPRLVYISNATEVGTFYTKTELCTISALCKEHDLLLFVDGARLGAALSAEGNDVTLEDLGQLTDLFWIGGTKVGALLGEAIIINNPTLKEDFRFHIKQRGALLAKGRILGSQFQALFRSNLFFDLARHANSMAKLLSIGITQAGYALADATETNQVFAVLPDALVARIRGKCSFYVWQTLGNGQSVIRLVTSWGTQQQHVDAFIKMLQDGLCASGGCN